MDRFRQRVTTKQQEPNDSKISLPQKSKRRLSRPKIDLETYQGKIQYRELIRIRSKIMAEKQIQLVRGDKGFKHKLMANKLKTKHQGNKKRSQSSRVTCKRTRSVRFL